LVIKARRPRDVGMEKEGKNNLGQVFLSLSRISIPHLKNRAGSRH
jgi:hypothetical protein